MYEEDTVKEAGFMDTMRDAGKSISKQYFLSWVDKVDANDRPIEMSKEEKLADWNSTNGDKEALRKMNYVFSTPHTGGGAFGVKKPKPAIAETEMNEAIRTIKTLRSELNEVNLLNAKLIYVNKIFKSKSLTEAQKIQVITSFDKATTTKEAKVVFESLTTALAATRKPIKESLGFASRAAGIAPGKQQIIESNDAVKRMQKLANIIK
jgi:hypothetical protein